MIWLNTGKRAWVAKFLLSLVLLAGIGVLSYVIWLTLRKQSAHPFHVKVVTGSDGQLVSYSIYHDNGGIADDINMAKDGQNTDVLLCLTAYLTTTTTTTIAFPMCIHEPSQDIYISRSLFGGFLYEHDLVRTCMGYLSQDPELGLLDIGANLGVYTLSAAHMGRQVVAVEALPHNILRLKTSIQLGGISKQVKVIQSAVSNTRDSLYGYLLGVMRKQSNNVGGTQMVSKSGCTAPDCDINKPIEAIFMDDLTEVIPFKKGLMKIDIEGYEINAFEHSSKLLDTVDFPMILMEWRFYRNDILLVPNMKDKLKTFVRLFTERDYQPCDVLTARALKMEDWNKWPMTIMWRKSNTFH